MLLRGRLPVQGTAERREYDAWCAGAEVPGLPAATSKTGKMYRHVCENRERQNPSLARRG
jgi:hypothetical protein